MNYFSKIGILVAAFALVGQGCLNFGGGDSAGTDGGVWQTANMGGNWDHLKALPQPSGVGSIGGVNVNAIEIDPGDDTTYYIGTVQNGMFYTHDNGSGWFRPETTSVREGNILDVEVDPQDVCTIYVLKPDRLLKSTNCSRTYETIFVESRSNEQLTAFTIDWFSPNILWMGTTNGEVLRTIDGGQSWTTLESLRNDVTAIEVSNGDSRAVLVGTRSRGLYRRDVDTGAFIELEDTLRQHSGADEVYGFTQTENGSVILMNTKFGLLRSHDFGMTWEVVGLITPPRDVRIWSVAIDPKNAEIIYYMAESTFHVTRSGGQSWETSALPTQRAGTALIVHPRTTNVVLAGFKEIE